jgi:hypothetical protein
MSFSPVHNPLWYIPGACDQEPGGTTIDQSANYGRYESLAASEEEVYGLGGDPIGTRSA